MFLISNSIKEVAPPDTVVRINLAWESSPEQLETEIKAIKNDVLLDYPHKRTKPPYNKYSKEEVTHIANRHANVKFLAISNVESIEDMLGFEVTAKIVPKIESLKAIDNIEEIMSHLNYENKVIMLDKEDLLNDLDSKDAIDSTIARLSAYCCSNGIEMIQIAGIVMK